MMRDPFESVLPRAESSAPASAEAGDGRLPVCVLTGFLGAGKSTLLNFVLHHPRMRGTAVLINEYGSIGVDHHLVESAPDDTQLIADGCLCCTANGQLAEALMSLFQRAQRRQIALQRVVIETTGLAEPGPILQQLFKQPQLRERFVVDSVVTLVDAVNAPETLDGHDIGVQQITGADRLLLTKADLVDEADAQRLERRLSAMNPDALVERVRNGAAKPEQLFSGAHRRAAAGVAFGKLFAMADQLRLAPVAPASAGSGSGHTPAEQDIQTFSLILEEPVAAGAFYEWLEFLRALCGPSLLRMKGIVNLEGQSAPVVIHGVQRAFHPVTRLGAWPGEDRRTRLVFITRGWGRDVVESTLLWLRSRAAPVDTADVQ